MQVEQTVVHSQCENEHADNWQSAAVVPLALATHQQTIVNITLHYTINYA